MRSFPVFGPLGGLPAYVRLRRLWAGMRTHARRHDSIQPILPDPRPVLREFVGERLLSLSFHTKPPQPNMQRFGFVFRAAARHFYRELAVGKDRASRADQGEFPGVLRSRPAQLDARREAIAHAADAAQ